MADFASREDGGFSEAWQWPRAAQEMARWHATLTLGRAMTGMVIKPETVIDLGPQPDVWTLADYSFEALRTPIAIVAEGATMHHCVATYLNQIMGGHCHIVSIKRDGEPIATLEIRGGRMTQLKGKYNAKPAMSVEAAARLYAELWLSTWAKPPKAKKGRAA